MSLVTLSGSIFRVRETATGPSSYLSFLTGSFHYCRRRWDLARDPLLRYQHLLAFEKGMLALEKEHGWLNAGVSRSFVLTFQAIRFCEA